MLSGTSKRKSGTLDPVHCSIYHSGALPGSSCGSLWSGQRNEFMNDSWFWQQGQPAFPTHWKAITSQAHRNYHGCWSFVDSVIVTQKWGNLSLRVQNTPVVSELEAAVKAMTGSKHQPTHIATETLLGNSKHLRQPASEPPGHCLSWNRKCQLTNMASAFGRLAVISWSKPLWKAERKHQNPHHSSSQTAQGKICMLPTQRTQDNGS